MASGIYGIGTRALLAFKGGLTTAGHNISNVNTEGYSRQRVEFSAEVPEFVGSGYMGRGVKIGGIGRVYDRFVVEQVRTSQSGLGRQQAYFDLAKRVDNLLGDDATALSPGLQSFFNAAQEVANDPTSHAARQVMLTEGETLTARLQQLDGALEDAGARVNERLRNMAAEINGYAEAIGNLNADIASAMGGGGSAPNDLLDQRDAVIEKLSKLVSVSVVTQEDGMANVFVGTGQNLVLGTGTATLVVASMSEDPDLLDIGIQTPGAVVKVTEMLTGGELGGVLEFRDAMLDPTRNALGRIAIGLGSSFNDQHILGVDLNGDPGQAFFNVPGPEIFPGAANTGSIQVGFSDPGALTLDDYRLSHDGSNWVLQRLGDGQVVSFDSGSGTAADPYLVNGISLDVSAANTADSYIIRPTQSGAARLGVSLTDGAQIAARRPGAGVGDNTNALALVGLQTGLTMIGGSTDYEGAYTSLIGEVGTRTRQAQINSQGQSKLLEGAQTRRAEISGVNLDEEAADLIRFQQAYEAAARVITTAQAMFDSLLAAVR